MREHLCGFTDDAYKNGEKVNNTRQHLEMDVDLSDMNNRYGSERGSDHSQKPKRLSWGKPYESLKWQHKGPWSIDRGRKRTGLSIKV